MPPLKLEDTSVKQLPQAVAKQMLSLATSGLGLVAALAWNEVVKETVNQYIKPYFDSGSGLISLLIYATIVTALAVTVTIQLTRIVKRLETTPS
ncbi:hypothetical protein HY333_00135 [Candidatus Collierbacteria bacterium]|nr:hypothetical protein [Candidatus Collierbacteria bacterium]